MRGAVLALVLGLLALGAGCGGADDDGEPSASGDSECESVESPAPRSAEMREAPTEPLDSGRSYSLVFETSCGSFTVGLDLERAPNTTASLVALARDGYFDETIFHRVVPDFVIQGGDPTQSRLGGPGYSTVDAPPDDSKYTNGMVAMAKTELDPPGTSGSQFFVVTGDDVVPLPPVYAIVGEVTEGIDTVERIEALGISDGPPSQPVVVQTVTVAEA